MKNLNEIIKIYEIGIGSTYEISRNRVHTNAWFSALNISMVALLVATNLTKIVELFSLLLLITLNVLWSLNISYYKRLNTAKFTVISDLETKISSELNGLEFFNDEYKEFNATLKETAFLKSGSKIDRFVANSIVVYFAIIFIIKLVEFCN